MDRIQFDKLVERLQYEIKLVKDGRHNKRDLLATLEMIVFYLQNEKEIEQ